MWTVYSIFGGWDYISGGGTFGEDGLVGNYTGGGKFIATPVLSFQRNLSTSMMAGNYNIVHPLSGVIGTVIINSDGQTGGSTIDGCSLNGQIWSPNPSFNQAYVDIDVSNCSDAGKVLGAAEYEQENQSITVIAADSNFGYAWTLEKW